MSYLDWHVGMKVVCVRGGRHKYCEDARPLIEGEIYTLRRLEVSRDTGVLNVLIEEVRNEERRARDGFGEPMYVASRFRPVQPRKTDISIFTAMLTGTKQTELA